MAKKIVIMQQR